MREPSMLNPEIESLSYEEVVKRIHQPLIPEMLERVFGASDFYRRKLAAEGITEASALRECALSSLPFTDKAEVVADLLQNKPFGSLLAVPLERVRRVHRTSGYSGSPVYIAYTEADIANTVTAGARSFWCAGVRPSDIVVHCLNYCLWTGGLTDHLCLERTGACVVPYGVGNSRNLLRIIREIGATAISCTPSYLPKLEAILASDLGLQPRTLGLRKGLFGGEPGIQDPDTRRSIEETWGIEAIDANYGVSDVLSIFGSECPAREGLHFHGQGIIHVELIDPRRMRPLDMVQGATGELVCSTLLKEGQPLVRFRTGDVVQVVGTDRCDCGRHGFRFRVLGRSDDMLLVKGINVFPHSVAAILAGYRHALNGEYQIVIDSPPPYDRLRIEVEVLAGVDPAVAERACEALEREIRERLEFTAKVERVAQGAIGEQGEKAHRIRNEYRSPTETG